MNGPPQIQTAFRRSGSTLPRLVAVGGLNLVWCFVFGLWCFIASGARAELSSTAFDAANKLYEQGKYAEAAAGYQKLLESHQISAALYYNLGNAYFKAGQLGRAITAYRQAEQLTPRDPDLRANLQFARNQVQGPNSATNRWQSWLQRLSLNEWTLLAAAGIWLFFLLLAVRQLRPGLKPVLRGWVTIVGISAFLACFACGAALAQDRLARSAIVVAHEAVVRQGTLDEAATVFTLHDGAEVKVLDQKDDWFEVTTGPRRVGWVRRDQVLLAPRA